MTILTDNVMASDTSQVVQKSPSSQLQDTSISSKNANEGDKNDKRVVASTNSRPRNLSSAALKEGEDAAWGSNFWVTLVDPHSQVSFYACPATGQVSWDPPVGSFVLPPSDEGEWWELSDDSRGGIPYYYQTKTGATVWERPKGFVIPLGIIQNTTLGRRLSQTTRLSKAFEMGVGRGHHDSEQHSEPRRYKKSMPEANQRSNSSHSADVNNKPPTIQKSHSSDPRINATHTAHTGRSPFLQQHLTPIPGSDASMSPSSSQKSIAPISPNNKPQSYPTAEPDEYNIEREANGNFYNSETALRSRSNPAYISHRPQQPQSLNAALEKIASTPSDNGHGAVSKQPKSISSGTTGLSYHTEYGRSDSTGHKSSPQDSVSARVSDSVTREQNVLGPTVAGKGISGPIPNHAATLEMSPVKNRAYGQPILVQPRMVGLQKPSPSINSALYPVLPADLAIDIQQFSESEFAQQYFATHRTGFIFKRRVPVTQIMTWQKAPLGSPLLTLNRSLAKDAVKLFKVLQHLMGDREREKAATFRLQTETHTSANTTNASATSSNSHTIAVLEEERWLLAEGISHGELRDEIYCQIMKQLTGNPNTESIFKGWQLLCVLLITFPPSKNFESYLSSFFQQNTIQHEGRVDVMAKYCLRRLSYISKKGPRGKPPTLAEIEIASDAAFHPSTFGESLDLIIRLQERKYPEQKVPIVLPFLADGILALGGLKAEGIFRVPGDSDSVSELKLRIDRGYYTTDGVTDPHVLASLMKLWLRELCDPLVPEEMYNECIANSKDAAACVRIIERLPTINRRVILFVISFLQLFLEEKAQRVTKMTPANLSLVMAPNLLRCNSDSMSVVFTNTQYEQIFVYNLLLFLQCNDVDPDYIPVHGLGATSPTSGPRSTKSRPRRT